MLLLAMIATTSTFLLSTPTLLAEETGKQESLMLAQSNRRVIREVTCPAEIKVGSIRNTGDWEIPTAPANYAEVKVEQRDLGGTEAYSAVCYYSAYGGKIAIEKVIGETNAFSSCEAAQIRGRGGVRCYAR